MKKLLLIPIFAFFTATSFAQNSFPSNGNVGIGTTNPSAPLSVSGAMPSTGTFLVLDDQALTGRTGVRLRFQSYGVAHWNMGIPADVDAFTINGWVGSTQPEFFRINSSGNVGIGISNPAEKLAVNGTIHAREVRVDMNGWPDYVFRSGYDLMPLEKLRTYVRTNGYLPQVPTENDVDKNGVNLGEMNKLLLKKVEELTLYLLQQEERIKKLEACSKRVN